MATKNFSDLLSNATTTREPAIGFINLFTVNRQKLGKIVVSKSDNNEFLSELTADQLQQIFGSDLILAEYQANNSQAKEQRVDSILSSLGLR